jgi:hypothetical protein
MKIDMIKNYIKKLTKEDIVNYLNKEKIEASIDEINLIYNSIKNDFDYVIHNDFYKYIERFKSKLNNNLFNKIIEKYNEYKKFIE